MSKPNETVQVNDSCDSISKFLFSYKPGLDTNIYGEFQNEFEHYQNYLPLYDNFFVLNNDNFDRVTINNNEYIKKIIKKKTNNIYECEVGSLHSNSLNSLNNVQDIFFKFSPLIDPIMYMCNEIKDNKDKSEDSDALSLPSFNTTYDPNNVSFIDGFFYFLSSKLLETHNFINGNLFFGQHLTKKVRFITNISEDIDYLAENNHFNENKDEYEISDEFYECIETFVSNKNKRKLNIDKNSNETLTLDVLDIDNHFQVNENNNNENNNNENNDNNDENATPLIIENALIFHSENAEKTNEQSSKSSKSYDSESEDDSCDDNNNENYSDEDSNENSDEDSDEYSDDSSMTESEMPMITATLKNFPVNMIGLECYKDTLDAYISEYDINEDEFTCILAQVIFTLIGYQKAFHFVHNDLHTNNVMFIETEKEFIYYKFNSVVYKIKTYGKLWKIIDYGRGTYKFNNQTMFSSSFNAQGDASTQYNCEPYYNPEKKIIEPNFSFDLCRLACSLYEDLWDDDVVEREDLNEVENMILDWCMDYKNRNIVIKNNGDVRYEGFKLYKMITRTVHDHIPSAQLSRDIFKKYITTKINKKIKRKIVNLDTIPDYSKSQDHW